MADKFELISDYKPTGDQPQAIETLTNGILAGAKAQTLLGVTGSGKHSQWQTLSRMLTALPLSSPLIKLLPPNFALSFANFSRKMQSNTSSPIMITTSRKRISPARICISKGRVDK